MRKLQSLIALMACMAGFLPCAHAQSTSSTLNVTQILERQEATYRAVRSARGDAVVTLEDFTTSPSQPLRSIVFFAHEPNRSITLTMPWTDGAPMPERWARVTNWTGVTGSVVTSGVICLVRQPQARDARPMLEELPYVEAAARKMPLVSFQPRVLGDESTTLQERLAAAISASVNESSEKKLILNIRAKDNMSYRYEIAPDKGCLIERILTVKDNAAVSITSITIGKSGAVFVPSKMEHVRFSTGTQPVYRESWYYRFLSVNANIPVLEFTGLSSGLVDLGKLIQSPQTPAPTPAQTPAKPTATECDKEGKCNE